MHELSIATSIVELASEEAARRGGVRVAAVYVKLGALSGVVEDALRFSWELACEETPAAGARLEIEAVPASVKCAACGTESVLPEPIDLRCPGCGSADTELLRGRELQVTALEIEDPPPVPAGSQ